MYTRVVHMVGIVHPGSAHGGYSTPVGMRGAWYTPVGMRGAWYTPVVYPGGYSTPVVYSGGYSTPWVCSLPTTLVYMPSLHTLGIPPYLPCRTGCQRSTDHGT